MLQRIKNCALLVREYDEAVKYYTEKFGFEIHQNFPEQNWVALSLPGKTDFLVTLCKAMDEQTKALVGKQTGSFPLFILETDDCKDEFENWKQRGVVFDGGIQYSPHGNFAIAFDLYGNKILLTDSKFF
jgi:catechol 2,3-dioxygenase-like lactoylglutathione lyase family enzyme